MDIIIAISVVFAALLVGVKIGMHLAIHATICDGYFKAFGTRYRAVEIVEDLE